MFKLCWRQLIIILVFIAAVKSDCRVKKKTPKTKTKQAHNKTAGSTLSSPNTAELRIFGTESSDACKGSNPRWEQGGPPPSTFSKLNLAEKYFLFQNVYAAADTGPGSFQELKCTSYSEGVLSWETDFSINSMSSDKNNNVKSYNNAAVLLSPCVKISELKKISSTWVWDLSNKSADLDSNVSYDIFTSNEENCSGQGSCASHEIMIWLKAEGGALPTGSKATNSKILIGKFEFELYEGMVGNTPVLSVIPANGNEYKTFSADMLPLLQTELTQHGLKNSEFVCSVGAGPEVFHVNLLLMLTK
ncbi:endoglucanase [Phakopsora pachyrhizi]|uniref:Endoglucanase n=1 Tax=Phakopsora pachyrhizi TaxID=170000 RepID=A0AAV0ARA1_PHAPC|nr:endoglucanase [Phakopsora pachyrhizi]